LSCLGTASSAVRMVCVIRMFWVTAPFVTTPTFRKGVERF